jgi:hypothetical protein
MGWDHGERGLGRIRDVNGEVWTDRAPPYPTSQYPDIYGAKRVVVIMSLYLLDFF